MDTDGKILLGIIGGLVLFIVIVLVDACTERNVGQPVWGVVVGSGFTAGQTHVGTGTAANGQVVTTVSYSGPDYSVFVQLPDRRVVVEVSRQVWESVKDGDKVAVQFRETALFGFGSKRLVVP